MKRLHVEVVRFATGFSTRSLLSRAFRLAIAGRPEEARVWFTRAAEYDSSGESINALGCFLRQQGELAESRRQFERLLSLAHQQNDDGLRTVAHHNLAALCRELGDVSRARVHQQHAWRLTLECELAGQSAVPFASGFAALANDAMLAGDWNLAAQLARLALDCDTDGQPDRNQTADIADDWACVGTAAYGRGEIDSAMLAFRRALRLHRRLGDTVGIGKDLLHLAKCLGARQRWTRAARLATLAARCFQSARHVPLAIEANQFRKTSRSFDRIARFDPRLN